MGYMSTEQMFDWFQDEYRYENGRDEKTELEARMLKRIKAAKSLDEVRRIMHGPSELVIICAEEDPADWEDDF